MNIKNVFIVLGEPNSTFLEILFKYFSSQMFKKNKKKIILIGNKRLLQVHMNFFEYSFTINEIFDLKDAKIKLINIINVDYKFKSGFGKITPASNNYIKKSFNTGINLVMKNSSSALINGPISKESFLKKKFPGITEYVGNKTDSEKPVMLIYNEKIAVSPITTHVPIKKVAQFIKKNTIIENILKINNFYRKKLKKIPKIAVLGLNPHCETTDKISEEKNEILPAIKYLVKKRVIVTGPISADTFFIEKNLKKFDVVVGMYHDQVLTPIKTIHKFNAINITLGLPFIKVSPDHGPNNEMIGKNKSDPSSIFCALNFLNKIK